MTPIETTTNCLMTRIDEQEISGASDRVDNAPTISLTRRSERSRTPSAKILENRRSQSISSPLPCRLRTQTQRPASQLSPLSELPDSTLEKTNKPRWLQQFEQAKGKLE